MTFIFRKIPFNSTVFRFYKKDVFAAHITQLFRPATKDFEPYFVVNSVHEKNELNTSRSFIHSKPYEKKKHFHETYLGGKLVKINLPTLVDNANNLPIGLLTATVLKLRAMNYLYRDNPGFKKELKFYTSTQTFRKFCCILDKNLIKIPPSNLPYLLSLVHYHISPESEFMKKVYHLILDNLNFLHYFDLIDLYLNMIEKPFVNIPECNQIKKACEAYFEKCLENDLSHCHNLGDLSFYLSEKNLPINVKQLIVEKFMSVLDEDNLLLSKSNRFFTYAFKEPILSLYKDRLLDIFKKLLVSYQTKNVYRSFSTIYAEAVRKYDYLFREDICDLFGTNIFTYGDQFACYEVLKHLSSIGYFNKESLEKFSDNCLSVNFSNMSTSKVFDIAYILGEASFHELNNPNWKAIKHMFESYSQVKNYNENVPELMRYFKYLIFLGCNVTDFLNAFFKRVTVLEDLDVDLDYKALLRLHHLSKMYFPDSDFGFSNKAVANILQNCAHKKKFLLSTCLHEYFGSEDYVLYNCYSPNLQFLSAVVLLGADNKPINLSMYKTTEANSFNKNFQVTCNTDRITKPPGSKMIVFLDYPASEPFKFQNAPLEKGYYKLFLKSYEGCGGDVVLLNPSYFPMPKEKKLLFLDSEVKKIIGKSESTE